QSTDRTILTTLSRSTTASVPPSTTFQYTLIQPCRTFAVSASGGEVTLFNGETLQGTQIGANSTIVKVPGVNGSTGEVPKGTLTLSWDSGQPAEISGVAGTVTVERGGQQVVRQGDQGELRIDYSENSVMTIHAVSGDYTL